MSDVITFRPWPKIARLNKDMVITEKLDGTNAAVGVTADGDVWAQSRTRVISPENDNVGFARWVYDNAEQLAAELGEGVHFGEWWGQKIQRTYDLQERRFSLFNTNRWTSYLNQAGPGSGAPSECLECSICHVVPLLDVATFDTRRIGAAYDTLKTLGSVAAPGFDNPEGLVVYHTANGTMFKLNDAK